MQILIVCNRVNLKRQLKIDLLNKFNKEIPMIKDKEGKKTDKIDIDLIDKITQIDNITITSYQAIQDSILDAQYNGTLYDLSQFDYIIMDECHYMFTDAAFNNKCRLAVKELISELTVSAIKVFISATMEEVEEAIASKINSMFGEKPKVFRYDTGIDYSYVNVKYFKDMKHVITTIKNDKTDNKWLVFISNKDEGNKIKDELGADICETIYSRVKNAELDSIIADCKFNKKVLVATKCLDNGINIIDDKLTNIVIMTWDKVSFIQMLGRKRINIDDAQEVNLYIPTRYKKSFSTKLKNVETLEKELELFKKDKNAFNRKYDNDLKLIGDLQHLFYRDNSTGEFSINAVGEIRLAFDKQFYKSMVEEFEQLGEYAFILKQLEWLQISDTFDTENCLEDVILNEEKESLEEYLKKMVGFVMLEQTDRQELIEKIHLIDFHNSNIKEDKIVLLKNLNTLNDYFEEINLNYRIKEFQTSKMINGKKKKFKHAWKVMKLTDSTI